MAEASKKKKVFDGRYEILSIVGRGSRSVVYHARSISNPASEVALKVHVNAKDKALATDRLRKEALAMVSSRHKYVVRLDDFHSMGDICYLSMEYAPEADLRKYVNKLGGKLSAVQGELFLLQAAEALAFIHQAGIVHRDIKPDNTLVVNERAIRIADFGVAVLPGEEASIAELQKGVGTMDYMAPEVLEGVEYTSKSDLYALGVMFYEMLSGVHPFANIPLLKQLEIRKAGSFPHLSTLVPQAPEYLISVIMQAVSYSAKDRFSSAKDLIQTILIGKSQGNPAAEKGAAAPKSPAPPAEPKREIPEIRAAAAKAADAGKVEPRPAAAFSEPVPQKPAPKPVEQAAQKTEPARAANVPPKTPPAPPIVPVTKAPLNVPPQVSSAAPQKIAANAAVFNKIPDNKRVDPFPRETEKKPIPVPPKKESVSEHVKAGAESGAKSIFQSKTDLDASRKPTVMLEEGLLKGLRDKPKKGEEKINEKEKTEAKPRTVVKPVRSLKNNLVMASAMAIFLFVLLPVARQDINDLIARRTGIDIRRAVMGPAEEEAVAVAQLPVYDGSELDFPVLPAGVYTGTIEGLVVGKKVPISMVSLASRGEIAVIVGLEGWSPKIVSIPAVEGQNVDTLMTLRVRSNGFVLDMTGKNTDGEISGIFKNVFTGDEGSWSLRPVGAS